MIVVDTSVLSSVFRRSPRLVGPEGTIKTEYRRIIQAGLAIFMPGIVFQEFLSGARSPEQHAKLSWLVEGLPIRLATVADHRTAADIANECQWHGVATNSADCLIAAQAIAVKGLVFTADRDFERMAPLCGLKLWKAGR